MGRKTKKQLAENLKKRRKVADSFVTSRTAREKDDYTVARKKLKESDKRQEALRKKPVWREFIKKHGINEQDLSIGFMSDEAEEKGIKWGKKIIEAREKLEVQEGADPVKNVHWNEDGTVTFTVNPEVAREAIHRALDEVLDERKAPRKKFKGQSTIEALKEGEKIHNEVAAGKTLLRIAKERCGIDENPAYNEKVNAEYQKVKRCYEKFKEAKK